MWSKRRNAGVSLGICCETGKLLSPAKSVKSRHTSSGCFHFSQRKAKDEKEAAALAMKTFPGAFVAGIGGTISRGPIKRELRWIGATGRRKPSKEAGPPATGNAEFSRRSSILMPAWISCYGNWPCAVQHPPPPRPQLSSCPRCFGGGLLPPSCWNPVGSKVIHSLFSVFIKRGWLQ